MEKSINRNSTSFLYEIYNVLKKLKPTTPYDFLTYYQYLTYMYFQLNVTRGLLIYHTMGMGKTLLAVAIAMTLEDYSPIVLSSLSLHENFIKDVKLYIKLRTENDPKFKLGTLPEKDLLAWINKKFKFVTLKASNMLKQLSNAVIDEDFDLDNKISELLNLESIEGKLLIVDEAHNLFRAISNGSKNAIRLYELIMKSKNIKLLFLTGTPIQKNPFELVSCFNMLGGYYKNNDENAVLPEKYADFVRYFIDETHNIIKNKNKFQNRIQGMVSYVTHDGVFGKRSDHMQSVSTDMGNFPTELPLEVKTVPMSDKQYMAYVLARENEKNESSRMQKREKMQLDPMMLPGRDTTTTYRIRSRQISNYYQDGIIFNTPIDQIPLDKTESPKFKMINEILKTVPGITMIFSNLLQMSGLSVLARYLQSQGWEKYPGEKKALNEKKSKCYAFISGDMKPEERESVKKVLNSEENKNGDIISVILISEAGAEGLDLKNIRTVIFLEPQWTDTHFNQIKFRAIRKGSHDMLDPKDRTVRVILLLAVKPVELADENEKQLAKSSEIPKNLSTSATTDVTIWVNSIRRDILNESFAKALQEVSIECYVNGDESCRMCNPTNNTLFEWNIKRDMQMMDPCSLMVKKEKELFKIVVNDATYYWEKYAESPFGFRIYYFDEVLNSYKQMPEDDIRFLNIISIIENI
jgi:superfamily II DNA or RNA helicase